MAKRGCIVDDMRVSKAGVKGWLARELPVQVRPAGAAGCPIPSEATTPARTGRAPCWSTAPASSK